jgi:hypothetical protein
MFLVSFKNRLVSVIPRGGNTGFRVVGMRRLHARQPTEAQGKQVESSLRGPRSMEPEDLDGDRSESIGTGLVDSDSAMPSAAKVACTLHFRAFPSPPPLPVQPCTTPTECVFMCLCVFITAGPSTN